MLKSCFLCFVVITTFAGVAAAQAQPYYQSDFPPEEFRARWEKVYDGIGKDAVAIVQGAPLANGFAFPRQTNEFYYLCGVETPGSYLLLDGRTRRAMLYLPPQNARLERSEGKVLSAADAELAKNLTGADEVLNTDLMRSDWLGNIAGGVPKAVYTLFSPAEGTEQQRYELQAANAMIASDYWDGRVSREANFVSLLRTRYPRVEVKDLTEILDRMRSVKSPREVGLIRKASQIAGRGIMEAIRSAEPGLYEYQMEAAARYVFLVNGARLEGYRAIAASGNANIWNGHYYRNSDHLKDGDWMLLDYAPDYHYYTSDVTRMFPVNGKYQPWQRELLGFVLVYRNQVLRRIRPGVTVDSILQEVREAMEPILASTKFSKPVYEQAARKMVTTSGGVFSHPVGLAVHDDGGYRSRPLEPGVVFSIDPQMWVPEESLYVRYEDVVVVTAQGVENFTDFLPSNLDEIEKLYREKGIIQSFAPNVP